MSHSFAQVRQTAFAALVVLGLTAPVGLTASALMPDQAQAASSKALDNVKGLSKSKSLKSASKLKKGSKYKKLGSFKSNGALKGTGKGKGNSGLLSSKKASSLKSKLSKYIDLGDGPRGTDAGEFGGSEGFSRGSMKSEAKKWKSRARDFARSLDF
ncbi:MAG: hypothetical protein AAFV45_04350 [Pseudomonadota bacterium]